MVSQGRAGILLVERNQEGIGQGSAEGIHMLLLAEAGNLGQGMVGKHLPDLVGTLEEGTAGRPGPLVGTVLSLSET